VLTARGWWFLIAVLVQIVFGIFLSDRGRAVIATVGLALLGWFLFEWLRFFLAVRFVLPRLHMEREVRDGRRSVPLLWAGREFRVRLRVFLEGEGEEGLPYVILRDRMPVGVELVHGKDEVTTALEADDIVSIAYRVKTLGPGEVRFEGVEVRVADLQGFFYHRAFVRRPVTYMVLPPLTDAEGKRRGSKSHNLLPPPGVHRLRHPGGGSELLDLRDYRPGDPPKMIAWKPSARRDRLITKEFESEVPLRCTLFVDTSQSVRLGPPRRTMLAQLTNLAAAVAQATIADHDHIGLVLFDEEKTDILAPARTPRHLIVLLHRLAEAARAAPMHVQSDIDDLLRLGSAVGHELYPDLMRKDRNRTPWRMFWRPLLDSYWGWLVIALLLSPLLVFFPPAANVIGRMAAAIGGHNWFWPAVAFLLALPPVLGGLIWLGYGLKGHFAPWHTHRLRRKRLAALFATLDQSPPGTLTRLTEDNECFARRVQEFLAAHHVRYPVAIYDEQGRYLFRSSGKIETLRRALTRSTARARDNELFVILADLIELDDELDPLLRAVKVALARHHHVVVVCPWLPDIPAPDEERGDVEPDRQWLRALQRHVIRSGYRGLGAEMMRDLIVRYQRAYFRVRRAFGRLGVLMIRADEGEPVQMILNRLDRLRGVRRRR
jgi:uncharacterized protein (DUF58 family)